MRWANWTGAVILFAGLLACGDDVPADTEGGEGNSTEAGDGDGDPGDGDGDPGDGDGDPGDGDGDPGDGDGDPGDGDGDPGDGDGDPGDGDGDPGDGDGDGDTCGPDGFLGGGIAEDGWGLGDLCDEIYVCVPGPDYDALVDLLDLSEDDCVSDLVCGDGSRCTISYRTVVDEEVLADACAALTIVDSVWCVVWGP